MSNLNYPKPVRFGLTLNSAAEIDVNNNPYFSYQFAKVNPITREEEHFLPTNRNLNKAFSVPIEISNGEWKLYIKSKEKNAVYVVIPIILLGFFLSIVGGFFAWFIASQPEKLRELVQEKTNQLKASENNYRNTLERITASFIAFDKSWRYTYLNDAACETHPEGRQGTIGKTLFEVHPEFQNSIFWNLFNDAMVSNTVKEMEGYYEPLRKWFSVKAYPSDDGLTVIYNDITEAKKADQKLIEKEKMFQTLFESSLDAILLVNINGKIFKANPSACEMFAMSKSELYQRNLIELLPEKSQTNVLEILNQDDQKNKLSNELILVKKSEEQFSAEFTSFLFSDASGEQSYSIIIRDITERKKVETELRNSELLFRGLTSNAPVAIFQTNAKGECTYVNPEWLNYAGMEFHEALGFGWVDAMHEQDREHVLNEWNGAVVDGKIFQTEFRFRNKAGKVTFLSAKAVPLVDLENKTTGFIGISLDITDRKMAEQALMKSEENYRSLIENSPDIIFRIDLDEHIQFINHPIVGYYKEHVIGRSIYDFMLPEFRDKVSLAHKKVIATKSYQTYETAAVGPNGNKRWYYTNVGPIIMDNEVVGITSISRDITDKKQTELEISEVSERLRLATSAGNIGVWDFNLNTNKVSWDDNMFKIYNIRPADFLGDYLDWVGKVHPDDLYKSEQNMLKALETNVQYHNYFRITWPDGQIRYIESLADILRDDNGKAVRMIGVNIDITEKKIAEDKLMQSKRELRQLSAHLQTIREDERTQIARDIHDELGQQLTGLKMDTSWLRRQLLSESKEVRNKVSDMVGIIDSTVKTVRKISSNLRPAILDDLGLIAALDWHTSDFEKRTGIKCKFNSQSSDLVVDKNQISGIFRICQETLTNVARHSNASLVDVTVEFKNDNIELTIKDNGIGFEEKESVSKQKFGLLGIRERAIMLGGKLIIESAKNKGAKINLSVPLNQAVPK